MPNSSIAASPLAVKGFSAYGVELKENELLIRLRNRGGKIRILALQGIIAFQDFGLLRRPLKQAVVMDKGSMKKLELMHKNGTPLFAADFMEWESR